MPPRAAGPRLTRRRAAAAGIAIAAATAIVARPALAARPEPLVLLIGAAPGNGPDRWARAFAPFLERHWARTHVGVVNLPGEDGLAAARALAAAAPDGGTLGVVATPALVARCIERGEIGLLDRLDFLAAIAEEPVVLVVPAASPASDLAALRALGERGLLGTPPAGSASQLAAAALAAALPMRRLAFPSAAAVRQAAMAGNLAAGLLPLPAALLGLREGRLLGVAIAKERRSPLLPEVPAFAELGIPLRIASHRGIALPRGVAEPHAAVLAAALSAAVADPEYIAQAHAEGTEPHHLPRSQWAPVLRRLTGELRERWEHDPWTPRGG